MTREVLKEEDNEFSDSFKKMTEFIASKINAKIVEISKWAAQGNKEDIDKFFEKVMDSARVKYGKYVSPENFTDSEARMLNKIENMGLDVRLKNDSVTFNSPSHGPVTIVKNLYADNKRLHYVAYVNGMEKAKSQPFLAEKRFSLRDLGALLTKLMK